MHPFSGQHTVKGDVFKARSKHPSFTSTYEDEEETVVYGDDFCFGKRGERVHTRKETCVRCALTCQRSSTLPGREQKKITAWTGAFQQCATRQTHVCTHVHTSPCICLYTHVCTQVASVRARSPLRGVYSMLRVSAMWLSTASLVEAQHSWVAARHW